MRTKSSWVVLFVGAIFLLEIIFVGVAEARGGGGGGGRGGGGGSRGGGSSFSRSSPASGGSFSSRPAPQPSTRPVQPSARTVPSQRPVQPSTRPVPSQRPENSQIGSGKSQEDRQDRRDDRQDYRDKVREDWQDHNDDDWDDHHDYYYGHGYSSVVVVGGTTETVYVATLPCDYATVVVSNGIQYYRCDDTWYRRGYEGGSVVYIANSPPPN